MGFVVRTRAQLLADGVGGSTISGRCRRGEYHRLLPGVYCEGEPTALAHCAAIVEWLPQAVLSHLTAAWLTNMVAEEPAVFEATVPPECYRRTPKWLRLYRSALSTSAVDESWGMATTSPAQTLFDCVTVLPEDAAASMMDTHLCSTVAPEDVAALCDAGRRGAKVVRRQLRIAIKTVNAASDPERIFIRALARNGVTMLSNHSVGQYLGDLVDPWSKTIIEIDGRRYHSESSVFRTDRRRQNELLLDGWLVLRFAAADVYEFPDACAAQAAEVVRRRRRSRARR